MATDFLFFLVVILIVFAVWAGGGGPNNSGAYQGPFFSPIGTMSPNGSSTSLWGTGDVASSGDTSPYRGRITLSRDTSGAAQEDPKREYVVIQASVMGSGPVSLAGWKLSSSVTRESEALPQASSVPKAGRVNETGTVTLSPGEEAIVVTGRSPIGSSFRENMCTGYFEEHQDFSPPLSLSCPTGVQEYTRFFEGEDEDDECVGYLRTISQCRTETNSSTNISNSCERFVEEKLSYDGCVATHASDANFASGTWRLYLNQSDDLWKRERETILLLDADNKVVDALSY